MTTNDTPSDNSELLQSIADDWKAAKEDDGGEQQSEQQEGETAEENAPAES